jgi:hypothetical protein
MTCGERSRFGGIRGSVVDYVIIMHVYLRAS